MELNGRVVQGYQYKNLNQARVYQPMLKEGNKKVGIFYLRSTGLTEKEYTLRRDFIMGMDEYTIPALNKVKKEKLDLYRLIGKIDLPNSTECITCFLHELYRAMQGEFWSPYGEALEMVTKIGTHTSMSIGDIIEVDNTKYIVESYVFSKIIHDTSNTVKVTKTTCICTTK